MSERSDHRLAVYGTLAPGEPNHHVVANLNGTWRRGWVRGTLHEEGWGAALGYPAIVLHDDGDRVGVVLLESPDLPDHWKRLDEFEGPAYRRAVVQVTLAETDETVAACIYELSEEAAG